jgi:uncharacterized protein YbbC (DUF1343 family)
MECESTSLDLRIGLERVVTDQRAVLDGRRFSVVMNRASIDRDVRLACDVLSTSFPGQLQAILTPQHGLWCEQQANMIETDHGWHAGLQVPVFSLYSSTRRPADEMLANIDCLVIDLQDVGTRVYTFIWTMLYCLQECAVRKIPVVVLDRPNPLGGELCEGPLLQLEYRSFVGEAAIPMRHGMTIGELAQYFNASQNLNVDLTVVAMEGWLRDCHFESTRRIWVPPSPNMQTVQTAFVYPGQVLLEGVNLSEGRGTTVPFEVVGAPFIDPENFCRALHGLELPGISFLPIRFTPSFDKWSGQSCGGVSLHVTNRQVFRSYEMTVRLLCMCRQMYPHLFELNPPPYEYEHTLMPLDIISGSSVLRDVLEQGADPGPALDLDQNGWLAERKSSLLY